MRDGGIVSGRDDCVTGRAAMREEVTTKQCDCYILGGVCEMDGAVRDEVKRQHSVQQQPCMGSSGARPSRQPVMTIILGEGCLPSAGFCHRLSTGFR